MDHRDDVTLYQTLRDANAAARADTYARGKTVLRWMRAIGSWILRRVVGSDRGRPTGVD